MAGDFGVLLRQRRLRLGLTQDELAARSGVSSRSISLLEAGRRRPRMSSVAQLADALDLEAQARTQWFAVARGQEDDAAIQATEGTQSPGSEWAGFGSERRSARIRPAQLSAGLSDFTGRASLVARLEALLAKTTAEQSGGPVVLSAIDGAGGVGKTTLAVHVAQRMLAQFPDGQLQADLHGVGGSPADPGDILARFLRGLGIPANDIPADSEERGALYRSTVAGRRILVLLDNVKDAAQVRPLLPGSGTCAVLITSRSALPGLDGAHRLTVDVLTRDEALELFTRVVGTDVVAAEPDAVEEVLTVCAGLPLAIRIAASRLACQPGWNAQTLADQLREESRRLDELQVEDRAVRASFAVGFAALPQPAARLFRLLGLAPGPTISLPAAVALAGGPRTEHAVWTLLAAHLLQTDGPARYRFHDLVRVYAAELATEPQWPEQREGVSRLLHWYLQSADQAGRQLIPAREPATDEAFWTADNLPTKASHLVFDGFDDAQSWFDAESQNLVAAVYLACAAPERKLLELAPRLVDAFWASVYVRGEYDPQWEGLCTAAIRATTLLDDPAAEATVRKTLGIVYLYGAKPQDAATQFERSYTIRTEHGDLDGALACAMDLSCAYSRLGRHDQAIDSLETALDGYRESGDPRKTAIVLNNLGIACHTGGHSTTAIGHLEESLRIKRELGDVVGQSKTLTSLAEILYVTGQMHQAAERCTQALPAIRQSGGREALALVLEIAALAYRAQGRSADAELCRTELDEVYTALGPQHTASVKTELERLATPAGEYGADR
jgi:transcriptional regulator with XRE-family HTH domain/tetratricopeptide (TPR) repeat protein